VDLQALVGDLDAGALAVELGHGHDLDRVAPLHVLAPGVVGESAGRLGLYGRRRDLVPDRLKAADLPAEGLALAGIRNRGLDDLKTTRWCAQPVLRWKRTIAPSVSEVV
jgi:hypothetical protein